MVAGSNPVTPTDKNQGVKSLRLDSFLFSCISRDGLTENVAAGLAAFSVFRGAECGVSGVKKIYEGV